MKQHSAYNRVVVKVGTNVLSNEEGLIDENILSELVRQLAILKREGKEIILVSSGAVGAARAIFNPKGHLTRIKKRQLLASVGQPKLMNRYLDLFRAEDLFIGQILATKEDFRDRHHYLNMRNCFKALMTENVIPIVNENDVIAIDELMFTDNDELAALVASMIDADALIILTNVEGVYNDNPKAPDARLMSKVMAGEKKAILPLFEGTSSFGRGGMHTKYRVSKKLAQTGIEVHIVNGKKEGIVLDLLDGKDLGTHFVASKKVSTVKKWIAYQDHNHQPGITINSGAAHALLDETTATSLLPIGIVEVNGDFAKGDVIRILDEKGRQVGMGLSQYGSETARNNVGLKGKRALIHYDYLYISKDIDF